MTTSRDRPLRPSRILLDLARGRLDEEEVAAVADWLKADARSMPSEDLIERALSVRPGLCSPVS